MAAKAVALKLNGRPFELATESPSVRRIKDLLDRSPKDELFTRVELAKRVGVSDRVIQSFLGANDALAAYSCKVANTRYWGHPAAIKALEQQMGGSL